MNLFTLYATLGLNADNFEKGVDKASRQGKGLASSLNDSVGGAAKAVGQKTSAMTIAMGTALYDLGKTTVKAAASFGKSIISEYADTEQMVDGVKTLFKNDASTVLANANNAFKTAGLSANEYMDTVTSFSASLLSGLGGDTAKAAEIADMAVQDMSDNANKFGTDMASIQNAYQGFAKQNYTMLDNLKLGYGGTKSEMQRLLKDARKIQKANGVNVKYSINNFNDIIEAIHVIQDEMGITGTTEAEAMDTISGSFNAFKASWKNWLSGLANDESDVSQLTDDLVESGKIALDNIKKHIPTIVANVTTALSELGTEALNAGADLLANLYTGLTGDETSPEEIKAYIGGVFGDVQTKINTVVDTGKSFFSGFLKGLDGDSASEGNISLKLGGLFSNYNNAKSAFLVSGGTLLGKFYTRLTGNEATAENIGKTLGDLFGKGIDGASSLLGKADTFFTDFLAGLDGDVTAESSIGTKLGGLFTAGSDAAASLIETGKGLLGKLYEGVTGQEATAENVKATLKGVFDAATTAADDVITTGTTFFTDLKAALDSNYTGEDAAKLKISAVFQSASDAMLGVIQGSKNFLANVYEAITGDTETAEKIRKFFTFEGTGVTQEEEVTHYQTSYQQIITDLANAGLLGSAAVDTFLDVAANEHIGSTKYKNMAALLAPMYQEYTSGAYEGNAEAERIARERVEKGLEWLNNGKMEELLSAWLPTRGRSSEKERNDAAYDWLTEVEDEFPYRKYWLSGGTGKSPYNPEWTTAWNYNDLDDGLDSAERMEQAAQALMEAAAVLSAALAGAEVTLDGEKVGELTSEYVKRDVVREMKIQFPNLAWGR